MPTTLLPQGLRAAVERDAGRPVFEIGGVQTSYGELDALSDRLAAALGMAGLGHGDRCGLCLPKGLAAYASLYAILKLGATYVPLDPQAPAERLQALAHDAELKALVATPELAAAVLGEEPAESLVAVLLAGSSTAAAASWPGLLTLAWEEALAAPARPPVNPANADDLAYILYTSGSTGRPKGVMISHRAALAFVNWAVAAVELAADDRVAAVAALHFDLSVFDLFATVAAGATLIPVPPEHFLRPRELSTWIASERISTWYSTPSTLVLLLEEGGFEEREHPDLRRVLFAGEVFPVKHLQRLHRALPQAVLYNLYGPTETNVCTWKRLDTIAEDAAVAIGQACAGTRVVALDAAGNVAEVEAEGELWVSGPTLLTGYWRNAEATAAALRPQPHLGTSGELWYRTGDVVHCDAAGDYHFRGRRDHQVKVRGYRVELGEVEAVLYSHPNVSEAAVVAVPDGDRGRRLCAAVVPRERERYSPLALKAHLARHLPLYMIPAEMLCLAALPKTSTGKVDRQTLATIAADAKPRTRT